MKKILFLLAIVTLVGSVYGQQNSDQNLDNTTDATSVIRDTGRQILREISVTTFEGPATFSVTMPFDRGFTQSRRILGGPTDKQPLRIGEQVNGYVPIDDYVLGIRADFYARSFTDITITATEPIFMPGIVKLASLWVSGRNKNHELSMIIRDMSGKVKKLPIGVLNYSGWRKLEVSIPGDIEQKDINSNHHGLYLLGFMVDTNFEDTVGRYYVYLDDMRIISDVIDEAIAANEADGDISDGW